MSIPPSAVIKQAAKGDVKTLICEFNAIEHYYDLPITLTYRKAGVDYSLNKNGVCVSSRDASQC